MQTYDPIPNQVTGPRQTGQTADHAQCGDVSVTAGRDIVLARHVPTRRAPWGSWRVTVNGQFAAWRLSAPSQGDLLDIYHARQLAARTPEAAL